MRALAILLFVTGGVLAALDVDLDDPNSIKSAAKLVASELLSYYKGNDSGQIPGILPGPPPDGDYYWWQGGALWGTMIDYWHFTGDTAYNDLAQTSMVFQAGAPSNSYQPHNWTVSLGNDDQGFWGLSAMLAAETKFQDPPGDQPQWLALAQAVFNTQADPERHDKDCNGGMRWQIPISNVGYDYKNTIANGIFFNLGARLARYTGNSTYADTAVDTWDWLVGVKFIDDKYNVYDGGHVEKNCTDIFKAQFSYNAGILVQGAAFMYNFTNGSSIWEERLTGLLNRTLDVFFATGPAIEVSCELKDSISCQTDMLSFKGYLHRWLASTAQVAPFTYSSIMPALKKSTAAAVKSCSGQPTGHTCGFRWTTGSYDGNTGAGQQMNALAALTSVLLDQLQISDPVTNSTGGTSKGDSSAGGEPTDFKTFGAITTADKAGAGIITTMLIVGVISGVLWISRGWSEASYAPVKKPIGAFMKGALKA